MLQQHHTAPPCPLKPYPYLEMADYPSSDTSIDSTAPSHDQSQSSAASPSPPAVSAREPALTRTTSLSKLNAQAPEFVPSKTQSTAPPRVVISPPPPPPPLIGVHVYAPTAANQPFHVPMHVVPVQQHHMQYHHQHQNPPHHLPPLHQKKNSHHEIPGGAQHEKDHAEVGLRIGLSEEANQKIINQVEFYFSDVNLATTDHLIRFINKDPEGYVPISVVASFKKIKALINNSSQLAAVLRTSTKLAISEDGKKVKRLQPLTGSDMEDLQCRIVVAENLPDDHCYQNLMKVFSSVGSVKSIRTCQPQTSNSGASSAKSSKTDNLLYCNKVHAFVEYESVELAEKAVTELNDEGDWRNGLRVSLLLKRTSKPAQSRGKKVGNEGKVTCDEDDTSTSLNHQDDKQSESPSGQTEIQNHEHVGDELGVDKEGGQKKHRNRGRGKGRGRGPHQNHRGNHVGPPPTNNPINNEHPVVGKPPPGPRMPDGTRGFSMGRGKAVTVKY